MVLPFVDLSREGIDSSRAVFPNLSAPELVEHAIRQREGQLTADGAFTALTGKRTGRSPADKFFVREAATESLIEWGKVNKPLAAESFDCLLALTKEHLKSRELYVVDAFACADPAHQISLRLIGEKAWHALFTRCLFLRPDRSQLPAFDPQWHIYAAPELQFDPARHGTNSETLIAISFDRKTILIAGTHYAGEIKKSIFTILNLLLPRAGVLSMHCSANVGKGGDVALFFGLSGTGKTTLSADPSRRLIGDDEHGWSDSGVFNIEGGCYAKTIHLSAAGEPQIWEAIRFGSVLENVPVDPLSRVPDYDSERYTENTRAAYPIEFIPHAELSGRGGHPSNVFFLTCDAFGVLPPISRLTAEQAMEHFLCGYTAKVAGTEAGVKEPTATFSTCFAAPFIPLPPRTYAALLRDRLLQHQVPLWLLNTGWSGGPYGVGSRMSLQLTRTLLEAALNGTLSQIPTVIDPIFGVAVPQHCPGVPDDLLQPRRAWKDGNAYDVAARRLAEMFRIEWRKYTSS